MAAPAVRAGSAYMNKRQRKAAKAWLKKCEAILLPIVNERMGFPKKQKTFKLSLKGTCWEPRA
jgi:hypothetical protein